MRTLMRGWLVGLLPLIAACGVTDVQAPALMLDEEIGEPFVEALDAAGLEAVAEAGAEFELVLLDDGHTVGEVGVRTEAFSADERIQSRVASFDAEHGRLGLLLGDVEVTVGAQTRFWVGDDAVSREVFTQRMREELSAGRRPPVVVERAAPEAPQGPEDETFVAGDVVVGGDGTPALRVKVGHGNVERVSNPSAGEPDAWLKVLGSHLRMRMRDGTTNATRHRHDFARVVGFEGSVVGIDFDARTLELTEGVTVRVTGRTDIVRRRGYARTLRAAAEALEQGNLVHARGLGVAQEQNGRLMALRVALKVEVAESEPVIVEFEGVVTDLRPGDVGMLAALANGTLVRVRSFTELVGADEHSPATLDELEQALQNGREVIARGRGKLVEEQPLVVEALRVELEGEAPASQPMPITVGNADFVASDGSVVLVGGTTVLVTSATQVVAADASSPATIQELINALDQNRRVEVRAQGLLDANQQVQAVQIVLAAQVRTFDLDVIAIDPGSGGLILAGGSFALLTQTTVITAVGAGPTDLAAVDAVLASGGQVRARGTGFILGRYTIPGEVDQYEVIAVQFEQTP
ncbi:MAG: DUF5666 domain-containing protein [Longimicrobiales bacterium]